jgi:hypothetical protein
VYSKVTMIGQAAMPDVPESDVSDIWDEKHSIAMGIALQTQVLKICPVHRQLFCDDEVDPAVAFAVAAQLIHNDKPSADVFREDIHDLADLLTDVISTAPCSCSECVQPLMPSRSRRESAMA